MTIIDRIFQYINAVGLNPSRFEKKAGLSNAYLKRVKGNIGADKIEDILKAFPDINRQWLMTGEGNMFTQNEDSINSKQLELDFSALVESNAKLANAVDTIAESNKIMAESNAKLTDNNTKLIEQLLDTLKQIDEKLNKKGAVEDVGNVAKAAARG